MIPSFLSIFKISFDEYVAAQKADVKGVSVVRVQKIDSSTPGNTQREQSVVLEFALPRVGAINNRSQKPFRFPKPKADSTQITNTNPPSSYSVPSSYPINKYIFTEDSGRGEQLFYFAYGGIQGNNITFTNSNPYDMLDVKIFIKWADGVNKYTSIYSAFEIKSGQMFTQNKNNTSEASIPYNPSKIIQSIEVMFMDNAGSTYQATL